jgi:hypothetical protein
MDKIEQSEIAKLWREEVATDAEHIGVVRIGRAPGPFAVADIIRQRHSAKVTASLGGVASYVVVPRENLRHLDYGMRTNPTTYVPRFGF